MATVEPQNASQQQGGRKLAEAAGGNVTWWHREPVTGSFGVSDSNASYGGKAELNADGINVGFNPPDSGGYDIPEPRAAWGNVGLGSECSVGNPQCVSCFLSWDASQHNCAQMGPLSAEVVRAEARYQSIYLNGPGSLGYDPEFNRVVGKVIVTYRNGAVVTLNNPTLDEYQQVQTAYLADSGYSNLETNTVTIIGGAEYFVVGQKRSDLSPNDKKNIQPPEVSEMTKRLTPCAIDVLSKYFDRKTLGEIVIHDDGLPPYVPAGNIAFTESTTDVYFAPSYYNPFTQIGLGVIAHEMVHIEQRRKYGNFLVEGAFAYDSVGVFLLNGWQYDAEQNDVEKPAYAKEIEIRADLEKRFGKDKNPCP